MDNTIESLTPDTTNFQWDNAYELLLKDLSEESQINSVLHRSSYEYFTSRNIRYQLPIIILSVLSGSANFISSSFPTYQDWIILGVGGISISTSIISSVSQFLKLSEMAEGHRIAYSAWEKFYSNIKIQLSKRRCDRDNIKEYMATIQGEYLRLKEISPDIPNKIVSKIRTKHRTSINKITSPIIVSGFRPIQVYHDSDSHKSNSSLTGTILERGRGLFNRIGSKFLRKSRPPSPPSPPISPLPSTPSPQPIQINNLDISDNIIETNI